jgi:hypothetical protein
MQTPSLDFTVHNRLLQLLKYTGVWQLKFQKVEIFWHFVGGFHRAENQYKFITYSTFYNIKHTKHEGNLNCKLQVQKHYEHSSW